MAVQTIPVLKTFFEAGDKPTETQFADLIDSCHNDNAPGGGGPVYDDLTSGNFISSVSRLAGSTTGLATPSSGVYTFTIQAGGHVLEIDIDGDSSVLDTATLTLNIDNSANSRNRYFNVQLLDKINGGLVDQQATGTNHTQTFAGNITTIIFPGMNGFSPSGFTVMLR